MQLLTDLSKGSVLLSGMKAYSEKWYLGYAFQGLSVLGVAPILIPLIVGRLGGDAAAGMVVAAFYLGQLTAPIWGRLADKTGRHHLFYSLGYALLAVGMVAFALVKGTNFWLALAFVQGAGSAATNTVAAMFIVEYKPQQEWDPRIGWLQTFYGTGQAIGLALAAAAQMSPLWGMGLAGALMVPGYFLGRLGLPAEKTRAKVTSPRFNHHVLRHPRQAYMQLHHTHGLSFNGVKQTVQAWKSPFGLFLLAWFFAMLGSWMVYNLYPLLMQQLYGVDAAASSVTFAIAATLGIFLYAPSGFLAEKIGDGMVLMIGIVMTIVGMVGMTLLAYVSVAQTWILSQVFYALMPMAWSPLIVAGTAYTAQLTTMPQGNALGVFNSITAIGSVLAALAAGWLAEYFGYGVVMITGTLVTLAGLAALVVLVLEQRGRLQQFKAHRKVLQKAD